MSAKNNFSVRGQRWTLDNPFQISSGTAHPSTAEQLSATDSTNLVGTWTHVVSNNMTMQVHVGTTRFSWFNDPIPSNDVQFHNTPFGVPQFQFPGLTLGGQQNYPELHVAGHVQRPRCDVNWHVGQHDMKFGGEFLRVRDTKIWDLNRRGTFMFNTRPSDADLERRFPADAWDDPSRWDISGLEPYLQRFDINFHPDYLVDIAAADAARCGSATTGA